MKKTFKAFLCCICAVALFSCEKETRIPGEGTVPEGYTLQTFTATGEAVITRTALSGANTVWSKNDQIKVILNDGTAVNAELTDGAGTATGTFAGMVPDGKTALYAVYPAAAYSSVDGTTVNVSVPADQTGTFSAGNIAVAKVGAENNMSFKNVTAFLVFQLKTGSEVTKVEVASVDGGALSGTVPVSCSGENPVPGTPGSTASTVSMTTSGAGTYYMTIVQPAANHTKGLKMTYYTGSYTETGVYYLNRNLPIAANNIYTLGEVETDKNYYVTVSGAGNHTGMDWSNAFSKDEMWKRVTLTSAQEADASTKAAKIAAIDGATFHLGHGTYNLAADPTLSFSDDVVTLTFKGGYPAAGGARDLASYRADFTGNDEHAVLNLRGKLDVTFDGIGFVHGYVTGDNVGSLDCNGTASGSDITVTMQDCLVDNNVNSSYSSHADEWAAGLVLVGVTSFTATNVTFSNNKSHSASAVFVKDSKSVFTNCTFSNNLAWYCAGAVYATATSGEIGAVKDITFNSCVFQNNQAETNDAGALYAKGGTVTINGGTFHNNSADQGGALEVGWGDVVIKGEARFLENEARLGGAIYNAGDFTPTLRISGDCEFNENHATGWAGAIHFKSKGILRVNDCSFTDNYSDGDSGALNIDNANAVCSFTNVTFTGNHADGDAGGVMWIAKGDYLFKNCSFANNYSADGKKGGGAIFAESSGTTKVLSCSFTGNHAKRGGAISAMNTSGSSFFIDACWFDGNYSHSEDAANKGTTISSEGTEKFCINNCSFNDNTYNTAGGNNGQGCDWIFINGNSIMTDLVISNCTLIGACRTNPTTLSTSGMELLYVMGLKTGSAFYCINNIIISTGKSSDDGMWVNGLTVNEYNNIYSSRGGSGTYTFNNYNNTMGKSLSDFGSLTWNATDHVYPWDGTGFSYTQISASAFATQLESGCSDFKTWLETEGLLNKDQLGNNRGEGSWVPGAYQTGAI